MSFWKKKENVILTICIALFFIGVTLWYDVCGFCTGSFFSRGVSADTLQINFVNDQEQFVNLDEFKGQPLILNFWATWCPVCVKKMSTINDLAEKFQNKGGKVIALSEDKGGLSIVRAFYAKNAYKNLAVFLDFKGNLMHAFGARGLPTAVFINSEGKEVGRIEGGFDWNSQNAKNMIKKYFGISVE